MKLEYGISEGAHEVRKAISALYTPSEGTKLDDSNVLMTNGASGANQLALQALVGPGEGVIGVYPTYGQLLEVPRAAGIDVSYWRLDPNNGWQLNFEELVDLIRPGKTRMIILNNPNNPTGTYISNDLQKKIVELAKEHNMIILSDEVFRPLFHDCLDSPKSLLDWDYDKVIVSGSMSKSYGMPGTRTGWLISKDKSILQDCARLRSYSIAYTMAMVEVIVAEALSDRCRPVILKKNLHYAKQCLEILDDFVKRNKGVVQWTKPVASSTTLIQFKTREDGKPIDDVEFCLALQKKESVLFPPASLCFGSATGNKNTDFNGYVRCHFVRSPESLTTALEAVQRFVDSDEYGKLPAATGKHVNGNITNGSI